MTSVVVVKKLNGSLVTSPQTSTGSGNYLTVSGNYLTVTGHSSGSSSSTSLTLEQLTNVISDTELNGYVLMYNSSLQKWVVQALSLDGGLF